MQGKLVAQALNLPQPQPERRVQHQAGLDGRAGIPSLPAESNGLPAFQRCVLDPQGEADPSAQARLIGPPVPYLERYIRNVVAAVGVAFMGALGDQNQKGMSILPIPGSAECINAPARRFPPVPIRTPSHRDYRTGVRQALLIVPR